MMSSQNKPTSDQEFVTLQWYLKELLNSSQKTEEAIVCLSKTIKEFCDYFVNAKGNGNGDSTSLGSNSKKKKIKINVTQM